MTEPRSLICAIPADQSDGGDIDVHVVVQGSGPPVLLLHGFTGSTESLSDVATSLQSAFTVYRVDLIGHGRSAAPDRVDYYTMPRCVAQLCALLDHLGIDRLRCLGYSMGARVILSLCAEHPERVCSALLIGASPGLEDAALRAQRIAADTALAEGLREHGIGAFVDDWMALPLFATQRRLGSEFWQRQRALRMANRAQALAASLEGMGCGAMAPLHRALPAISCQVCLVVGSEDTKFLAIARAMMALLPRSELMVIAGAGHAAHVEQPQVFARVARQFFLGKADIQ